MSGRFTAARVLRTAAWTTGVAGALAQAIVYRTWVNADSTSYLDMSDGVVLGDWHRLVNATWSPLYPALIGLARLASPGPAWDFPSAHLVNFLSFLFAFVCYEYLLLRLLPDQHAEARGSEGGSLPRLALLAVAYALFLWSALGVTSLMKPTPDLLMSGFFFLATGLLVRIRSGADDVRHCALLGVALGLGYLAKAIMFPLGIVMLGMTLLFDGSLAARVRRVAIGGAVMLLVSAPYLAAVSSLAGHATFGDAGKVVHLTYLDGATPPGIWATLGDASGRPLRPSRQLFSNPNAYAFPPSRIRVTRSVWFDPALTAQGVHPGFNLHSQLRAIRANVGVYRGVVVQVAALVAALLVLAVLAGARGTVAALRAHWPVWMTALAALAAYALIHVETRYLGPLVAAGAMALLCGIRLRRSLPGWVVPALAAVAVLNLVAATGWLAVDELRTNRDKTRLADLEAGRALNALGVAPGSDVVRINYVVADGWARLARVHIVGEVQRSDVDAFWATTPEVRRRLLDSLATTGARAAVAHVQRKYGALPSGWTPLGPSTYAVHSLGVRPPVTHPLTAERK